MQNESLRCDKAFFDRLTTLRNWLGDWDNRSPGKLWKAQFVMAQNWSVNG